MRIHRNELNGECENPATNDEALLPGRNITITTYQGVKYRMSGTGGGGRYSRIGTNRSPWEESSIELS